MYTGRGGHRTYFVDESNTWGGDTAQHRKMGGDTAHTLLMGGTIGVGTPHNIERKSLAVGGWGVGGPSQEIIPLRGSILQAETCQILSLAENPRWSRVWQKER